MDRVTATPHPYDRAWLPIEFWLRLAEIKQERWLDEHKIRTDSPAAARHAGERRRGTGRGGPQL